MNISHADYRRLTSTWWLLKIVYGIFFVWSGLYKILGSTTALNGMVNPEFAQLIPLGLHDFFILLALLEVAIGVLILSFWPRLGAYLAMILLVAIIVNLVSLESYFTLAINNCIILVGILAFARLTTIRKYIQA